MQYLTLPNKLRTTPRIKAILDALDEGLPIFDICCDHGLIGMNAALRGLSDEVYFWDKVPHIVESLAHKLEELESCMEDRALRIEAECLDARKYRLNYSLKANFIIAGVGAELCLAILGNLEAAMLPGSVVVCQVNRTPEIVVERASGFGLVLQGERVVNERGRDFLVQRFLKE